MSDIDEEEDNYPWDSEPDGPGCADDHYGQKPCDPEMERAA